MAYGRILHNLYSLLIIAVSLSNFDAHARIKLHRQRQRSKSIYRSSHIKVPRHAIHASGVLTELQLSKKVDIKQIMNANLHLNYFLLELHLKLLK